LNEYLYYYYYAEQALYQIQQDPTTRGEEILELNQALLKQLNSAGYKDDPQAAIRAYIAYEKRRSSTYMHYAIPGGPSMEQADRMVSEEFKQIPEEDEGYAGMTLDIITALQKGSTLNIALNIPNQGAISGMAADDVVEVSTRISGKEICPIHMGRIPSLPANLMQTVKHYERFAVDAILNRSIRLAVQALMSHPLVLSFPRATRLVDEYLKAHAAYVGEWN
jgi:6-phospho-beta-glucosidase